MDPVNFDPVIPEEPREPNRRERRATASRNRKSRKIIMRRLNGQARKGFERVQREMGASDNPEVAEQYGFK